MPRLAWTKILLFMCPTVAVIVNGNGAVCAKKTSKLFVSHVEESIAGHGSVNVVY
jgi:hypothetical protein